MYGSLREIVAGGPRTRVGRRWMAPPIAECARWSVPAVVPGTVLVAPPILWLANGGNGRRATVVIGCLTWIVVSPRTSAGSGTPAYPLGSAVVAFIMLRSACAAGD